MGRATEGSGPMGDSGTVGEVWPLPMQVEMLLVKAMVLGLPAWQKRRRCIVSVKYQSVKQKRLPK